METLVQLGLMFGFGMAFIEGVKIFLPNLPERTIQIILFVLGGIAGFLWSIDITAAFGLGVTLYPLADRIINVVFVAVYFLVGPKVFHDLMRKAQGEVEQPQEKTDLP